MAEQSLDMAQTQPLFEEVRGVAVAQGMERDFFLIPQDWTTAFIAACAPPRSIGRSAPAMRSDEPSAFGNSHSGLRCLDHRLRSAR